MNNFFRELENLKKHLLTMGGLVETSTRNAVNALVHRRQDLVSEVISTDREIDAIENSIDTEALTVLALHQPVAQDLRFILTVMKINNELERMGDHAKNIASSAAVLCRQEPLPVYSALETMADKVQVMVKEALDAMVQADVTLARKVRADDDAVDADYKSIFTTCHELMHKDGQTIDRAIEVLSACRNLERIGDLATNIAKDVIFLIEGQLVRHGGAMSSQIKGI